jgi:hypothetical protein
MANEEHLEIIGQGVDVWNEWRERNPEIKQSWLELEMISIGPGNLLRLETSSRTVPTSARLWLGLSMPWTGIWQMDSGQLAESMIPVTLCANIRAGKPRSKPTKLLSRGGLISLICRISGPLSKILKFQLNVIHFLL